MGNGNLQSGMNEKKENLQYLFETVSKELVS